MAVLGFQIDSGEVKAKAGMGITVSTMARTEEDLADNEKTIFDWCAEENIDKVASLLHDRKIDVNCKNKEVSHGTSAQSHKVT